MLDFTEMTSESFELFARDFLRHLRYEVLEGPDRGPDGQRDLFVREKTENTGTGIVWLVSCKHFAGSNRSVGVSDEIDPAGSLEGRAGGFMGFYSTVPSSGLTKKLEGLRGKYWCYIYDHALIENHLLERDDMRSLIQQYFPLSYRRLYEQDHPTRLRVSTEAGFSLYAKDIVFELDSLLHWTEDSVGVTDPETESVITASYLARQLRSGNTAVLHGVASFNPTVWRVLRALLSVNPPNTKVLASAIRSCDDPLRLRLLISLAGELECSEVAKTICERLLHDGRRCQSYVRDLELLVSPFFDVARRTLGRMPADARPLLAHYQLVAKQRGLWAERRVLESAIKEHDRVHPGRDRMTGR